MSLQRDILSVAQQINSDIREQGFGKIDISTHYYEIIHIYDELITNKSLRRKTEKLFKDGHHARAVKEAYKLLDNLVKKKAKLQYTDLTGAPLMQRVFSPSNPKLKLNECVSTSEKNEQSGYMQIFAGCMTGIRNPRAHDSDWEDTADRALQLLTFANHLIERTQMAEIAEEAISEEKGV